MGNVRTWRPRNRCAARPRVPRARAAVPDKDGYRCVYLRVSGAGRSVKIHRAVLEAFVGPCPPGMECRHKNGVSDDNRLSNLCWSSHHENEADKADHGTRMHGEEHRARCRSYTLKAEDHGMAKLTNEQAKEVLRLATGKRMTQRAIADAFGVSQRTVSMIKNRRAYASATSEEAAQ
jgi:DNA-binding CsgD family transcriptional regulator